MWHGTQRKTLSLFGAYITEWHGDEISKKIVIYISEIIEKSALFAKLLIQKAVAHINQEGLELLKFRFDAANHFRSYESAYFLFIELPRRLQKNA